MCLPKDEQLQKEKKVQEDYQLEMSKISEELDAIGKNDKVIFAVLVGIASLSFFLCF